MFNLTSIIYLLMYSFIYYAITEHLSNSISNDLFQLSSASYLQIFDTDVNECCSPRCLLHSAVVEFIRLSQAHKTRRRYNLDK